MTQLGADPDALSGLSTSLRQAAGRLDSLSSGLARRTRSVHWQGPDADRVRHQVDHRAIAVLSREAAGLRALADRAAQHRLQQLNASADAPHGAAPATVAPTGPAGPPPLPPLPRVEERLRGVFEVRVGPIVGAMGAEVTVAHLDDGRRRVTVTERGSVGGVATAGATADLAIGGPHAATAAGPGTSGELGGRLGALRRRSWEVDDDDVDDLLARVVLERSALSTVGVSNPAQVAAGALDAVAERLTGRDPGWDRAVGLLMGVPPPRSTDELIEVELFTGGGLGAGAALGLGARGQATGTARVGTSLTRGRPAAVLEVQQAGTAVLTSTLLRRAGVSLLEGTHRETWTRLELVPADPVQAEPSQLTVRTGTTVDDRVHEAVIRLTATDDGAVTRQLRTAAELIERREPTAALAALAALDPAGAVVQVERSVGELSGQSARAGARVGAGLGAGLSVRGHSVRLDRAS